MIGSVDRQHRWGKWYPPACPMIVQFFFSHINLNILFLPCICLYINLNLVPVTDSSEKNCTYSMLDEEIKMLEFL